MDFDKSERMKNRLFPIILLALIVAVLLLCLWSCAESHTVYLYKTELVRIDVVGISRLLIFKNGLVVRRMGQIDIKVGDSYAIYKLKDKYNAIVEKEAK